MGENCENKVLLSFIVPAFNEQLNIPLVYQAVVDVMGKLPAKYGFELLFTDNCSTDNTFAIIEEIAKTDDRVRGLRFSKNFGYQNSILTGYLNAKGDAAIQLDCDLQDPPEMVVDFVREWEAGNDVVYGVRRSRKESFFLHQSRKMFYRLVNQLSDDPLPLDAGDFRLVSRRVIEELRKIDDLTPYIRGSIAVMGYNQKGLLYDRNERKFGESKFPLSQLISLAIDGILNHSIKPLRIATYTGLFISIVTVIGFIVYASMRLFFANNWPSGFTTLVVLTLLSISLNAMFLGILGEYIGRIYKQVKKKPLTIIQEEISQGRREQV